MRLSWWPTWRSMRVVTELALFVAVVLALYVVSAWLMGAEWGNGAVPDPIRRFLGVAPK